jgi:hypothetical protein
MYRALDILAHMVLMWYLKLTVGVSFIYIFYIRLHTPSTTLKIHSALDALPLLKEKEKPIEIFFSRFYFYFNLANSALFRICTLVVLEALM